MRQAGVLWIINSVLVGLFTSYFVNLHLQVVFIDSKDRWKNFFCDLQLNFANNDRVDEHYWRKRRVVIKPGANFHPQHWKNGQVYNGSHNNIPVSLLFRQASNDFITVCNLARWIPKGRNSDSLVGSILTLKDDNGDDVCDKTIIVESTEECESAMGKYVPAIPLEMSPVRFRMLIPLERATDFVNQAVKEWEDKFVRVSDRLPLRVGVVTFPRRTPFQAVIEAVRKTEDRIGAAESGNQENGCETWQVIKTNTGNNDRNNGILKAKDQSDKKWIKVELMPCNQEKREYSAVVCREHWLIPRFFGNNVGKNDEAVFKEKWYEDVFYPYAEIAGAEVFRTLGIFDIQATIKFTGTLRI